MVEPAQACIKKQANTKPAEAAQAFAERGNLEVEITSWLPVYCYDTRQTKSAVLNLWASPEAPRLLIYRCLRTGSGSNLYAVRQGARAELDAMPY